MPTGTVKLFDDQKGYGFIISDENHKEYFVHYTSIIIRGCHTLKKGQRVQFQITETLLPKLMPNDHISVACIEVIR
jgi:CspA family cold shock protein